MANMKEEYINVIKIAMDVLHEASTTNQTTNEQWRIFKNALEEICPCEKGRFYECKGGKYQGEGILDGIAADHVSVRDFKEITKEEFENEIGKA